MGIEARISCGVRLLLVMLLAAVSTRAQFTGNIQGTVVDPSGAAIAQAKVALENLGNHISATTTTDGEGGYRFLSLAPGSYKISVEAAGFSRAETTITLETNQNLNVPFAVKVGAASSSVTVTAEAPLLNTAETRNQLTLETQELSTLPLAGRNPFSLVNVAPGVSGLGLSGGAGVSSGTPGTSTDIFSTETALDLSANGQGTVANMWVVDSLDITSNIRQGVLNLVPNPDVVQETSIQVNTFSVEYGRGSGLETTMTTKSGSDEFHGLASDYFTRQSMYAKYSLGVPKDFSYSPFHGNNLSGTIGGPIIPHHQFFFFFGIDALRSSVSTGSTTAFFPDPAFVSWAQANHPNTFGTKILSTYVPTNIAGLAPATTAQTYFGKDSGGNDICGTSAVENIPCGLAMTDSGTFNGTNFRNGTQYFLRVDKYFKNDRVYG